GLGVVELVPERVVDRRDAPDHLAVPASEIQLHLGVGEEGVLLPVQEVPSLGDDGRNEVRIVPVQLQLVTDELVELEGGADRSHLDRAADRRRRSGGLRLGAAGGAEGSDGGGAHAIPWVRYHATVFSRPGSRRYSGWKPISCVARAGEQVQASWAISF